MLNEFAKEWVSALRSGEYEQAAGALRTTDGFCCLGVACDLYQKKFGGMEIVHSTLTDHFNYDGDVSALPFSVLMALNMKSDTGALEYSGKKTSLATLNDEGVSFEEIADIIETDPKGLFF